MGKYQNRTLFVYRLLDSKEADRILYTLTEEGEKLVIVAKGIKKERSRKAHAIDMLNLVSAKLTAPADTNGPQLAMLLEVQLIEDFSQFKRDYPGLIFAQLVCELVGFFAEEGQEDKGIYANVVHLLQAAKGERYALLAATLILRLLNNSGILPELGIDAATGEKIPTESTRYLVQPVGYTANRAGAYGDEVISDRIYKSQQFILKGDFTRVQQLALSAEEEVAMFDLHVRWLQESLEKELKTAALFRESLNT
jgi:DNA repair protein RecO